ncbi:MAG: hypothetical protein PHP55_03715 [Methanoculleus sp.]|nr:hypothetical protein [Methanoculleus sp.]
MSRKIGMRALPALLAMLLVSAGVVLAVSAQCNETSDNQLNIQSPYFKSTDKVVDSMMIPIDAEKYNKPMSKEEFYQANEEYIKFLSEQFGEEVAAKMVENAYAKMTEYSLNSGAMNVGHIEQILNEDVYIWPYVSRDTTMSDDDGPINLIFFNIRRSPLMNSFITTGQWQRAMGWGECGLRGDSLASLQWVGSDGVDAPNGGQLENGSYFTTRHHLVLFDGCYDSDIGYWCYGNCHYEEFRLPSGIALPYHGLYDNSMTLGRDHVLEFARNYRNLNDWTWVNLSNGAGWEQYHDGWGIVLHMPTP